MSGKNGSIRTLVVDDDAHVAEVHQAYVERVPGFEVVGVAYRGAQALEMVDQRPVDLVLLDFYLPDVRGLDVCRVLRGRAIAPVDVIAITAARDVDTVRRAIAQGVVQYLIKPFSFATFREKLERYASYRAELDRRGEADQAAVDGMLRTLRGAKVAELPKGLSRTTYDIVIASLQRSDGVLTAQEVADDTGISRVTARRYLEHLVNEGLASLTLQYGRAGRPEHRYGWAETVS